MADFGSEVEQLDFQLESLESNIAATALVTAHFHQELKGMQSSMTLADRETSSLSRSLSRGLSSAFGDVILGGAKFSDVLGSLAQTMIRSTFKEAINPVSKALSGLVSGGLQSFVGGIFANANGGAFVGGRPTPFAQGGVVSAPTLFPMRGGTGLMGEAGPEAIMPLSRGPDGALGVKAAGGTQVTVNMNVSAKDAESFRRSQTQIAAGLNRAIQRGNRNT